MSEGGEAEELVQHVSRLWRSLYSTFSGGGSSGLQTAAGGTPTPSPHKGVWERLGNPIGGVVLAIRSSPVLSNFT